MAQIAELKSQARVIEIRGKDAVLADLAASVQRETDFEFVGVKCDIKWNDGKTPPCYQCPHYTTDEEHDHLALICEIGRHQVDLITELDAIKAVERLDGLLLATYQHDVAACEEMAAALL